jgi:hypothetical protein
MSKEFADVHPIVAAVAKQYQPDQSLTWFVDWQQAIARFARWLFDEIAGLFALPPALTDTHEISNLIRWGLCIMGIIAGLIILRVLWSGLLKAKTATHANTVSGALFEPAYNWQGWHNQALNYNLAKQWKQACRALLLASLRLLDESNIVPFMAAGTNFEYWYALTRHKKIRAAFRSIADLVDLCWFGNKEANQMDFQNCLASFQIIQSEVNNSAGEQDVQRT